MPTRDRAPTHRLPCHTTGWWPAWCSRHTAPLTPLGRWVSRTTPPCSVCRCRTARCTWPSWQPPSQTAGTHPGTPAPATRSARRCLLPGSCKRGSHTAQLMKKQALCIIACNCTHAEGGTGALYVHASVGDGQVALLGAIGAVCGRQGGGHCLSIILAEGR